MWHLNMLFMYIDLCKRNECSLYLNFIALEILWSADYAFLLTKLNAVVCGLTLFPVSCTNDFLFFKAET